MKTRGKLYLVLDAMYPYQPEVMRPNRVAAGMTRCRAKRGETARTLAVYGTLDSLRGMLNWKTKRSARACPCCGQRVAAVVLSDHGRAMLARLRRAREVTP